MWNEETGESFMYWSSNDNAVYYDDQGNEVPISTLYKQDALLSLSAGWVHDLNDTYYNATGNTFDDVKAEVSYAISQNQAEIAALEALVLDKVAQLT